MKALTPFIGKAGLSYVYLYFALHLPSISPRRLTMSIPHTPKLEDEKIESLSTQREYLNLLRLRHLQWLNDTLDADIQEVHLQTAELIQQITDHYDRLLGALRNQQT